MSELKETKALSLMPGFMREDETVKALAGAVDEITSALHTKRLSTWASIDELQADELDALADELRVLWYNYAGTLDQKREQVKTAYKVWQHLGTTYAVELAITPIFGAAHVLEFWQYPEGLPHHFKIAIERPGTLSDENVKACLNYVEMVKRASQICDGIELTVRNEFYSYAGMAVHDISVEKYEKRR